MKKYIIFSGKDYLYIRAEKEGLVSDKSLYCMIENIYKPNMVSLRMNTHAPEQSFFGRIFSKFSKKKLDKKDLEDIAILD
ncbi:hypothetical protein COT72_04735 [archaeon CG10_big_fil_rev_8_21_14_0_10_43_11]|nr:MAG: hypothetical protein COT72_04735 [archaeon CG10_big_fil_rev_8_21_14_0_10_43_11]